MLISPCLPAVCCVFVRCEQLFAVSFCWRCASPQVRHTTTQARRAASTSVQPAPPEAGALTLDRPIVVVCLCAVSAARLRGFDAAPSVQQHASAPAGDLVSFMQSHQRAFAQQSQGQAAQAPSQQAQEAASHAMPAGAAEGDVLSALVQTGEPGSEGTGEAFGSCKTCVFVLERIKKGSNMLLPAICSELYHKYPDAYALCHQVLNALSINGNNVRYWLFEGTTTHAMEGNAIGRARHEQSAGARPRMRETARIHLKSPAHWRMDAAVLAVPGAPRLGSWRCDDSPRVFCVSVWIVFAFCAGCFKYEIYQSKEWIKPCPSHVMCSVLKDLSAAPFCPALPMENPFIDAAAAAGGEEPVAEEVPVEEMPAE